jgi:hypothetical protein
MHIDSAQQGSALRFFTESPYYYVYRLHLTFLAETSPRMEKYSIYAEKLRRLLGSRVPLLERTQRVGAALDGEASREVRRLLELNVLRGNGVFFTSSALREFALRGVEDSINSKSIIFDPTCGAGDLLIGATASLPIRTTFAQTLQSWSSVFSGLDLHSQFVNVCRRRLTLAAWQRHQFSGQLHTRIRDDWFEGIREGSGLTCCSNYHNATHILLNPPFVTQIAAENSSWGAGNVNSAAIFLETALSEAKAGTRIVAILPEVIRCGSRYKKFRRVVEISSSLNRLAPYGLFDCHTDVDVFVLDVTTSRVNLAAEPWDWAKPALAKKTVGDTFTVSVGPVVDFRDEKRGQWFPYLTVNSISPWEEAFDVPKRRRFTGRVVKSPFVVVRRTSRPGDRFRAVGSIIRGATEFAVDNHLIVCEPRDHTLRSCRELIEQFRNPGTTAYLDSAIRCRHLTVSSVNHIPWNHHG